MCISESEEIVRRIWESLGCVAVERLIINIYFESET